MKCIICEKEISIPLLASLYLKNDYTVCPNECCYNKFVAAKNLIKLNIKIERNYNMHTTTISDRTKKRSKRTYKNTQKGLSKYCQKYIAELSEKYFQEVKNGN